MAPALNGGRTRSPAQSSPSQGFSLSPEQAAFVQSGVSVVAASRDASLTPMLARAIACRVSPDRRRVTLFLRSGSSRDLLRNLEENGALAAVFSQPSTHRTLQLKGGEAALAPPRPADFKAMARQVDALVAELVSVGLAEVWVRTFLAFTPQEVVAVSFVPRAAYVQTAGPGAGAPLPAPPCA